MFGIRASTVLDSHTVRYSDESGTHVFGIQVVTVPVSVETSEALEIQIDIVEQIMP